MSIKALTLAILAGAALTSTLAAAATAPYAGNPERSFATYDTPAPVSRATVLKELADFNRNPVTTDGWRYVGGERQWAPIPHTFAYSAGKFEHTDVCDHSVTAPTAVMRSGPAQDPSLYKSAV